MTDQELARRCLNGDTGAFDTLVRRHQSVLYHVAVRMVHDAEAAQDIVQTAFVKAFTRLHTYDQNHKFFSWLYRIMMNEALNYTSRHKPCASIDDHAELRSPAMDPGDRLDAAVRDRAVDQALRRLSDDQRIVVILRHFANLSYAEIAAVLRISEDKVKSRLYAARRRLSVILAPWSRVP